MTYGEKRLLAGGIIVCSLLLIPIIFLLALPLYGIVGEHATGLAIVASGVIEFFITIFVWPSHRRRWHIG